MTPQELMALPGNSVGTKIAAEIIGCSRYGLNLAAKQGMLALDHTFSGNRLYISKAALLRYMGYGQEQEAGYGTLYK